jgi:hypothetical protein
MPCPESKCPIVGPAIRKGTSQDGSLAVEADSESNVRKMRRLESVSLLLDLCCRQEMYNLLNRLTVDARTGSSVKGELLSELQAPV